MRKSVILPAGIIIVVILIATWALAQEKAPQTRYVEVANDGRYQLFQGVFQEEYPLDKYPGERYLVKKSTFKIDTRTGETWTYALKPIEKRVLRGETRETLKWVWEKVEEGGK